MFDKEAAKIETKKIMASASWVQRADNLLGAAEEFKKLIEAFPEGALIHPKSGIDVREHESYICSCMVLEEAWGSNFRRHFGVEYREPSSDESDPLAK